MRLDKYLADMSYGTRSTVKQIIKKGRVTINDVIVKKTDYQLNGDEIVKVDEIECKYVEYEYYLLNKPQGYICALNDYKDPVVMELIKSHRKDLVPVGRLDKDTEGALLITNDGMLNHQLLSPKNHIVKKYYVELDKDLPDDANDILSNPIEFEDFTSKPAIYQKISNNKAFLTISEGKYHQVERMFEKVGCTVTYLKRISFSILTLDGLNVGEYRKLTEQEITQLKNNG